MEKIKNHEDELPDYSDDETRVNDKSDNKIKAKAKVKKVDKNDP